MNKPVPNRQSIRLKNYDYSKPGYYFITICTQNREILFGEITVGAESISARKMELNNAGNMVLAVWNEIPKIYDTIQIDEFIIMPNHTHGIIHIVGADSISALGSVNRAEMDSRGRAEMDSRGRAEMDSRGRAEMDSRGRAEMDSAPTVGTVVQTFKRYTTIEYVKMVKQNMVPPFNRRIWQRNYWEHIVRDENELNRIRNYIRNNPQNWKMDNLHDGSGNMVMETPMACGVEFWMIKQPSKTGDKNG